MEDLTLNFEWPRATYDIANTPAVPETVETLGVGLLAGMPFVQPAILAGPRFLVSKSNPQLIRFNRRNLETVVSRLIEMVDLPDKEFERRVRLLSGRTGMLVGSSKKGTTEELVRWRIAGKWLAAVFRMPAFLKVNPSPPGNDIGRIDLRLVTDGSHARLELRPHTLFDALIYTAARMKVTGTDIRRCQWCSKPFQAGGRGKSSQKIASARFCSDQCRYDFNNARRRKG